MSKSTKGIIFDLDGTLIDSAPDLHAIANAMLAKYGHAPLTLDTIISFIGNGIAKLVERCFEAVGSPRQGDELKEATIWFLKAYEKSPATYSKLYAGVFETLEKLRAAGFVLGICTNKREDMAKLIVDQMGLEKYFSSVVGGDRVEQLKPAPEPLYECAKEMGCDISNIVYVGDSEIDSATARAANVPFVLFTEGYRKILASDLYHQALYCKFTHLPHLVRHVDISD
jgi:phosphoglycolate phosphatase